jgi:hypothetical protein
MVFHVVGLLISLQFRWDLLKTKGLWTFGSLHTNALIDDTLLPQPSAQASSNDVFDVVLMLCF